MAKQEKRKTSLGNALGSEAANQAPSAARWRSASDSTPQPTRRKLFRSVREAMEFEAAEEAALRHMSEGRPSAALSARSLSSLENTHADQAGYTVIRRRAVSDPDPSQESSSARSRSRASDRRAKSSRNRRTDRTHSGATATSCPPNTSQHSSVKTEPNPASAATTNPAEEESDAQRWLQAASSGAVLSGGAAPSTVPSPETAWSVSVSAWPPSLPTATVAERDAGDAAPSQPPRKVQDEDEAAGASTLDENMLSWIESALSLDATRAMPSSQLHTQNEVEK